MTKKNQFEHLQLDDQIAKFVTNCGKVNQNIPSWMTKLQEKVE